MKPLTGLDRIRPVAVVLLFTLILVATAGGYVAAGTQLGAGRTLSHSAAATSPNAWRDAPQPNGPSRAAWTKLRWARDLKAIAYELLRF